MKAQISNDVQELNNEIKEFESKSVDKALDGAPLPLAPQKVLESESQEEKRVRETKESLKNRTEDLRIKGS